MEWLSLPNPIHWQRLVIWVMPVIVVVLSYIVYNYFRGSVSFRISNLWNKTVIVILFILVIPIVGIIDHYWACREWFHFSALAHHEPIILAVVCFGFGILSVKYYHQP